MIFGILGKFRIEIGDPNFFVGKIFVEKNSKKVASKNLWDQKFSIFVEIFFDEKVNENSKF